MAATHRRRGGTGDRVLGLVLLLLELVAAAAAPTGKEGPQGNFPLQSDRPENYGQNNKRQQQEDNVEEASTFQLQFIHNTLKTPIIYTHKTISAFDGQPVEVAIYRNGQVITFGPLSSLNVEIVALRGNFRPEDNLSAEDFDRQIVTSRDEQAGSVLEGCCLRTLLNGRQSFDGIRFKEGSFWRQFTLAARVVRGQDTGGLRVHEAFMRPVTVKDSRSEANEKSDRPKLNDKVYRLKRIAKNGQYFQRLQKESIRTVQDFLKAYHRYPERLRINILQIKSDRSTYWKEMTEHALNCDLGDMHTLKKYMIAGENVVLFFNCVHDLVGAEFHGHYFAKEKFDESQKAVVERRKEQAYNELEGIELDYVMKDGCPINISTSINFVGHPPYPMQDAIPQPNPPDQHATYQVAAVDNSGPAEINRPMSYGVPGSGQDNFYFPGNNGPFEASTSTQNNLHSYQPGFDYHPCGETESQADADIYPIRLDSTFHRLLSDLASEIREEMDALLAQVGRTDRLEVTMNFLRGKLQCVRQKAAHIVQLKSRKRPRDDNVLQVHRHASAVRGQHAPQAAAGTSHTQMAPPPNVPGGSNWQRSASYIPITTAADPTPDQSMSTFVDFSPLDDDDLNFYQSLSTIDFSPLDDADLNFFIDP